MTAAVKLDPSELHLLVTWGYAICDLDRDHWGADEQELLDKIRALRNEYVVPPWSR